jgi:hypothetical protein
MLIVIHSPGNLIHLLTRFWEASPVLEIRIPSILI